MNKAIKLVMTGLLVSANMLAQETDSIQQYGRGISVDWKESTTAGGMVTAGQLSHKTSVNPLTHYLVLFQDYMCYRMPAVPGQMVLLCMYVVWGLQTAKAR